MSQRPLSDLEILANVYLMKHVPDAVSEPAASALRKILGSAERLGKDVSAVLAVWPDGTFAMLLHNAQWREPRAVQLVRAYRNAYAAGIRMGERFDGLSNEEAA